MPGTAKRETESMTLLDSMDDIDAKSLFSPVPIERAPLGEEEFKRTIVVERKRTERSGKPFLLALLSFGKRAVSTEDARQFGHVISALSVTTRETDTIGWYTEGSTIGVVFTDIATEDRNLVLNAIMGRISEALRRTLTAELFTQISISFHFFPDDWDEDHPGNSTDTALYPELSNQNRERRGLLAVKRAMDICGSLMALILGAPAFIAIAAAVKLTSSGPIIYKQKRVGQHGRCFTFFKFRSMYMNNDPSQHREYVAQMIAGTASRETVKGSGDGVYKLTGDKRITAIGKYLRKTSLDELPQFVNVLIGDMSLVGPRPPIPYEVASYYTWHRRRMLEVKPGITGLWQVNGRNRIKFDDMVRLDMQYAKRWSPWLDLKILLQTPRAVIRGAC